MRFRRRHAALHAPSAADRIAAVAEHNGADVEEVLRDVADFRLALETDLLIAAAAVDAGAPALAAQVVEDERAELAEFQERVLDRLAGASANRDLLRERREMRIRVRHARLVAAAAAVLGLVGGGIASRYEQQPAIEQVALAEAEAQLDTLARATINGTPENVEALASELHETLEELISEHASGDADVAMQIAAILHQEQALLDSTPDTRRSVLMRVSDLAKRLTLVAPRSVRRTIAPLIPVPTPQRTTASPKPKPSASPKPSRSPSPSPTSTRSSNPSPSSSQPGPIGSVAP